MENTVIQYEDLHIINKPNGEAAIVLPPSSEPTKFYYERNVTPTAPLIYPEFSLPRKEQSTTLTIESDQCCKCNERVNEYSHVIVRATCGHIYHIKCASGIFDTNPLSICNTCRKEPFLIEDDGRQHIEIEIKPQDIKKMTTRQKLALDTLEKVHDIVKDEEEVSNISALTKGALDSKSIGIFFKKIDTEYIKEKDISMSELQNAGITIEQIYYKIGIEEWSDLLSIGFKRKHLKNKKLMCIPFLSDKYNVKWQRFEEDLGMTIESIIKYEFGVLDMYSLGICFDTIMKSPNKKKILYGLKLGIADCVRLGFRDDHIYDLNITKNDLEPLGWKPKDILRYMEPNSGVIRRLELAKTK